MSGLCGNFYSTTFDSGIGTRLRDRGTESEEAIQKRLDAARGEILHAKEYDYVVINDTVENAVEAIQQILRAEKYSNAEISDTIEGVLNHD